MCNNLPFNYFKYDIDLKTAIKFKIIVLLYASTAASWMLYIYCAGE